MQSNISKRVCSFFIILITCFIVLGFITRHYTNNYELTISVQKSLTTKSSMVTENPRLYFTWSMLQEQKKKILSLLNVFLRQLEKYNITYIPFGGTLLGVHRHHGIIPWDDDIDIMIDKRHKEELKPVLGKLSPQYKLVNYSGDVTGKWKFFKADGDSIGGMPFRYPYIDIFFYRNHSETEMSIDLYGYLFKKDSIYPMISRSLNGVPIYMPCDTDSILQTTISSTYGNVCESATYNHSREYSIKKWVRVNCSMLMEDFPFVQRRVFNVSNTKMIVEEELVKGKQLLQTVRYSVPRMCEKKVSYYPIDFEHFELNE